MERAINYKESLHAKYRRVYYKHDYYILLLSQSTTWCPGITASGVKPEILGSASHTTFHCFQLNTPALLRFILKSGSMSKGGVLKVHRRELYTKIKHTHTQNTNTHTLSSNLSLHAIIATEDQLEISVQALTRTQSVISSCHAR